MPSNLKNSDQARTGSELNQLVYCAVIAVVVGGFGVYRYFMQDYWLFLFDITAASLALMLMSLIWRRCWLRYTGVAVSCLIVFSANIACYMFGPSYALWAFPCLLAPIFMIKPKKALALIVIGYVCVLPPLYFNMATLDFARYAIALLVNLIYGCTVLRSSLVNNMRLEKQSFVDALTGMGNRRALAQDIENLQQAQRLNNYSLAVIDLDYFKQVNDQYGHITGDKLLQQFSTVCQTLLPQPSTLYRYGGEEFVVVGLGDAQQVQRMMDTLREQVQDHVFECDIRVSFSAGVSNYQGEPLATWIARADAALLRAKQDGRACVRIQD